MVYKATVPYIERYTDLANLEGKAVLKGVSFENFGKPYTNYKDLNSYQHAALHF